MTKVKDPSSPTPSSLADAFSKAGKIKDSKIKGSALSSKIKDLPAKHIAIKASAQRVSRRLMIASHNELLTCVCDVTGIVSILNIPAIPVLNSKNQKVLIWSSPLASLDNCRGLAQAGDSYLRKLDTQTLAGILIVLADHYDLFRYQPSDSGAQKNAVIRTAGKDVIINSILLAEEWINSSTMLAVPKLSLIMDTIVEEGGISIRMTEWLKEVTAILYLPLDRRVSGEDEFYSTRPFKQMTPDYIIKAKKESKAKDKEAKSANWAKTNAIWAAQREYKADKKTAKELILAFCKESSVSPKIRGLLNSIFTEDTLLAMDEGIKAQLVSKLGDYSELKSVASLILLIKKDRSLLMPEEFSLEDDLDSDSLGDDLEGSSPSDSELQEIEDSLDADDGPSKAPSLKAPKVAEGIYALAPTSNSIDTSNDPLVDSPIDPNNALNEVESKKKETIILTINGESYSVNKADYESLSFIEKIKFKRSIPAIFADEIAANKESSKSTE